MPPRVAPTPAKFTAPVPKYDGNSCPISYLLKFENSCKINHWPKDTWLGHLAISFEGTAERFYFTWLNKKKKEAATATAAGLPRPVVSFDDLARDLQASFSSFSDKAVLEEKCRARRQLLNENPENYTFALLALLMEYDPDMSEIEQVRWLIRNSRPTFMKQVNMQKPKTVDEFLDKMRTVEHTQYLMAERNDTMAVEEITALVTSLQQPHNDNTNSSNNSRGRGSSNRGRRPVKCYSCQGPHYQKFCPELQTADETQSTGNTIGQRGAKRGRGRGKFYCTRHGYKMHNTPECRELKNEAAMREVEPSIA